MYIIGIDIGKNHHEASIVSPEGKQWKLRSVYHHNLRRISGW